MPSLSSGRRITRRTNSERTIGQVTSGQPHPNPHWPPAAGLATPNVPASEAIITTYASAKIYAPASVVFESVRNVWKYGAWNTFCPKVTIHTQPDGVDDFSKLHVGTEFTFHVVMDAKQPNVSNNVKMKVTDISTPDKKSEYFSTYVGAYDKSCTQDLRKVYRISWKAQGSGMLGWRTERFHEIIVLGDHECEVRTWENQSGTLARTASWYYKKTLQEKFRGWCQDLKKFCERSEAPREEVPGESWGRDEWLDSVSTRQSQDG